MQADVWVDLVCPWCYLGKRRLDAALVAFEHRDDVVVRWRSFQLAPDAPREPPPGDSAQALAETYGIDRAQAQQMQERVTQIAAADGLQYHLDRAQIVNTYDAHRLVQLAGSYGRQSEVAEALFAAHLVEGRSIADPAVLVEMAARAGDIDADAVTDMLDGPAYALELAQDQAAAAHQGIGAVPHFVVERDFALTGAHSADRLLALLRQAWGEADATAARLRGEF